MFKGNIFVNGPLGNLFERLLIPVFCFIRTLQLQFFDQGVRLFLGDIHF